MVKHIPFSPCYDIGSQITLTPPFLRNYKHKQATSILNEVKDPGVLNPFNRGTRGFVEVDKRRVKCGG
ncbi:MAG: hypothetical protein WC121_13240 [Candidatus Kapaibacterium sp.]